MTCPHCQQDNPDYATICVWCGQHMTATSKAADAPPKSPRKRLIAYIAVLSAVLLTAAVLCAVLIKPHHKDKLIGTWAIDVSVGELMTAAVGDTDSESTLAAFLSAACERDVTVTVYCRFYENDTYSVYVRSDDLAQALEQLTHSAVTFLCGDGLYDILEQQGLSKESVDGILQLIGLSTETLGDTVYETVNEWMKPLYDRISSQLTVPNGDTGERYYELDDDRLYLSLEDGKRIEESVYIVMSFDGEHIRLLTGTQLDRYLTGLVLTKVSA